MAANSCGGTKTCQIGPTARDAIFAMNLADVSTLVPTNPGDNAERAHSTQLTLNDLDTDCPQTADATYTGPQKWADAVKEFSSYTKNDFNRCNPRLAIPMAIKQYGYPYWKHCNFLGNKFGWFDPPGAVPTATGGYLPDPAAATTTTGSEPEETSVQAFPSAAKSMPSVTKDPTTDVSTDDRSTRAAPTGSASDAQERPDAGTDVAAAEDHPASTSSSPPKDQGKQATDAIAKSKAADAVVAGFKSGATETVIPTSSVNRPFGDTNPTGPANVGAPENDGDSEDQVDTEVHDDESDTSKAGAHKDDSDPNDQTATTADDHESDTSNEASHKLGNDPKDQTADKAQDNDSNSSSSAAHKDDSGPKDQAATKAQNDDEPDTSNSAARVLTGIFHGIAQDDPAESAESNQPEDTDNAAGHSIDSSETSNSPTADEDEDPSGQSNVKSPADPSQSIAETDGDDGKPVAQGESSPDGISGSPALGQPTRAVADDSAHLLYEETDAVPVWTTVNGHVVSASKGAQSTASANGDLQGDSGANRIGGPDDPEMPSSSTAAGNRDQADRVAGSLTDESDDSSPNAASDSDSDSDSAEFGSTASPTKDDGDVASDGAAVDPDGSASVRESLGGATATGTESLPSPTTRSNPSLSSADAQASTAPISKDENGGTRPGVIEGSGYVLAALYAMVFYHF
jgi:hypothetical protein